ncbi:MAG: nucleotide sugar dehydrogenase [Nanoarchaeota archaeon]
MKILVTGGAGFIGFHVAKALLERGDEVVVIDDMNSYYDPQLKKERLSQIKDKISFYQIPLWEMEKMRAVFQAHKFAKVCHLAAQAGVRYSLKNPFIYNQANVLGTLNVLELMREFGVKDLVFASSSSVYGGNKKVPFSVEDSVDKPMSLYAATKKTGELYARVYHNLYGFNCYGLRFFTVYGPWGRPDMALFKFTKAILADEPIEVYNYGEMKRDFTHIEDIVRGVLLALDKVNGYDIFNLGNNRPVELNHFIDCLERALQKKAKKKMMPLQPGDVPATYADIEHTKEVLGWEPQVSIEEGINEFVAWYKEYQAAGDKILAETQAKEKVRTIVRTICVVGLGYVGLPLAVHLSRHFSVIGFDINKSRINDLKKGVDSSGEMASEELSKCTTCTMEFTSNPSLIRKANFIIACIPTPIDNYNQPDLSFLQSASKVIGENLSPGAIVVYESTVYPGVTEEVCVPVIEEASNLKCGVDFKVGYSPERINPGDKERTIDKIKKIVSGMDEESLNVIDSVYSKITSTHRASSIKVAEAAKVIENIQRDLNIALVNELNMIFDRLGINTQEVIEAAGTKWNFHKYHPGLVGGHCIGIDPYYLTYKAVSLGYHPQVILAGRRINDDMHKYYAEKILKLLSKQEKKGKSKVLVLGLTFKPNVSDARNSRVKHLIHELKSYNVDVSAYDPFLSREFVENKFAVKYVSPEEMAAADIAGLDVVLLAVEHKSLLELIEQEKFPSGKVVYLKGL